MSLLRDIFVNLLSDAIWAIGGFMLARFLLQKKSHGCDLLLKKRVLRFGSLYDPNALTKTGDNF